MEKAEAVPEIPESRKNATLSGTVPSKVGYKHPPKEAQFLPGNPGGPGAPLGSKHFTSIVYKLGNAEITQQEAIDGLKIKYGVKVATHFVEWFDELVKIAMDQKTEPATRRAALADLLKFFVQMPNQGIDLGPSESLLEYQQKKELVMKELLASLNAGKPPQNDTKEVK
jgi:hypothetical protein